MEIKFDLEKIIKEYPAERIAKEIKASPDFVKNEIHKIGSYAGWLDLQIERFLIENFKTKSKGAVSGDDDGKNFYEVDNTSMTIHYSNPEMRYAIETENSNVYNSILKLKENVEGGHAPEINDPSEIKKRLYCGCNRV